jgi:hypothetical protein
MFTMMNATAWKRLGMALHALSYMMFGFFALGLYYEIQAVFGSREKFLHNQYSMLMMFGLAMLLAALRDNELTAEHRYRKVNAKLGLFQWTTAISIGMFSWVVLLGLFFLFYVRDKFQGEAILTFGVGGLAMFRLEYDCLSHVIALRERHEEESSRGTPAGPDPGREQLVDQAEESGSADPPQAKGK